MRLIPGNVFANLGLLDAEERDTKVLLAFAINRLQESRRLSSSIGARKYDSCWISDWANAPKMI